MPVTQRRLSTVAIVVSTAAIALSLSGGGPAIASTVVAFAKNAGAVDGKSAVSANATLNQRKGKLVATGANTGLLPNTIIAQAPDSAKLGGIPLSGLAPTIAHATATGISLTETPTQACRTPVLTTTTASVATVEGELLASAQKPASAAMIISVSLDGGTTWNNADGDWASFVTVSNDAPVQTISHVATTAIPAHTRVQFEVVAAAESNVDLIGNCSLTATVLHRTPGTVLTTTRRPSTTSPGSNRLLGLAAR